MSSAAGSTYVYVTYIRTTPEKLWAALTDPSTMKKYWFGCTCESDFKKGSPWRRAYVVLGANAAVPFRAGSAG